MKKGNANEMVDDLLNLKKKQSGTYPNFKFSKSSSDIVINELFNLIDLKKDKKAKSENSSAAPVKQEPLTIKDEFIKVKLEE